MSLSIRIPDANFTYNIGSLTLPNRTGLIGEWLLGGSHAESVKNRAGGANMTVVGSPVYGAGYAEIRSGGGPGSVGFETGIAPPNNGTIISVIQKVTGLPVFLSTDGSYTGFLNTPGGLPALFNSNSGAPPNIPALPAPTSTKFVFYAGQLPLGGRGVIWGAAGGALTSVEALVNGSASRPVNTFKMGTTIANGGAGVANEAYAAIFNRVLTNQEIADAYASLKAFLPTRGLEME